VIQRWVQSEQTLAESVLEACGTSVALGAYAYADAVSYLFLDASGPYALSQRLEADRPVHAVSAAYPAFAWDEREMADAWAVSFKDLPDPRPLRAKNGLMPAPVIAHGAGLMHFVVGPVHAGIIEAGRFTFSSGGETVVHLDAQLSYGHRGVEKQLEGRQAVQSAWMVARICGGCSASRSYAYARALEQLAGTMVGREVELARVALAELERIYNHLADLAASAAGAGWGPGFARGMALKERAMRLCQLASGHRLLFDAIAPGGVGSSVFRNRSEVTDLKLGKNLMHSSRQSTDISLLCSTTSRLYRAGTVAASSTGKRPARSVPSVPHTVRRAATSTSAPLHRTVHIGGCPSASPRLRQGTLLRGAA
jgi:hypothetical protein